MSKNDYSTRSNKNRTLHCLNKKQSICTVTMILNVSSFAINLKAFPPEYPYSNSVCPTKCLTIYSKKWYKDNHNKIVLFRSWTKFKRMPSNFGSDKMTQVSAVYHIVILTCKLQGNQYWIISKISLAKLLKAEEIICILYLWQLGSTNNKQ